MKTMLIDLLQNMRTSVSAAQDRNGAENEITRRIAASIEHMLQNLNKPLAVSRLASAAKVSESHFFVLFRQCTGSAPIDFLIRLRMEQACCLLKTTELSVGEIGATVGYDDPFYFSRVFKSVNQVSPRQYREKIIYTGQMQSDDEPLSADCLFPKLVILKLNN